MIVPFPQEILDLAKECAKKGSEVTTTQEALNGYSELLRSLEKPNGLCLEYAAAFIEASDEYSDDGEKVFCNGHWCGSVITGSPYGAMWLVPLQYTPGYLIP